MRAELAASIHAQASRLGAEILIGAQLVTADSDRSSARSQVGTDQRFGRSSRVPVSRPPASTTVGLRPQESRSIVGAGIHYGSAPGEAVRLEGRDVVIVGGGNSAGQAALHMAEHAQAVTVVVRGPSLQPRNVELPRRADRTSIHGSPFERPLRLPKHEVTPTCAASSVRSEGHDEPDELAADAMFLLIGARPITTAVEGWLRRDEHGFLLTGEDVVADARDTWWKLSRDPYPLESSQPGVFVAGDLRHGSIKRVASAVGEGAMAASLIHRYLALERNG